MLMQDGVKDDDKDLAAMSSRSADQVTVLPAASFLPHVPSGDSESERLVV